MNSEELARDLGRLGVANGDTVMVHASLRAIGPVEGRADGVVRGLELAVGRGGTLLMNVGARDDWGWVNERPESERPALLADAEPFDAFRTPADPDNGVLAEVFRRAPGTVVSDHPEGRFGARGAGAEALLADVPWDDYYGPGSPLERLVQAAGKVLRLGADPGTTTLMHYAEYLVPLPEKRRVRRFRLLRDRTVRVIECLDDAEGIVEWAGEDYFALILHAYLEAGRAIARGHVGQARSELLDAADLVAFSVDWMSKHLA
jgi:aminoglycoside N3'-acetyltransferase